MGRGNMYYISREKNEDISHFTKDNFEHRLEALLIDYMKDLSESEAQVPLGNLQKAMQELGAITSYGYSVNGNGKIAYGFVFGSVEEMKKRYFTPKLGKLKANVEALTLFDVIKSAPALDFICNDETTDLIILKENGFEQELTMDDFIRHLEAGVTYYVYNRVILMH